MQRNNQGTKAAKEDRNSPPDILARRVIGCAIEVHRALGPGFLESVYEEALAVEMGRQRIPYSRQHPVSVYYRVISWVEANSTFLSAKSSLSS